MGMGYVFIAPEESLSEIMRILPEAKAVGVVSETPGVRLRGKAVE
jgi:phosphoribosylformylglycinamidine cyclo-ligase